MKLTGPFTQLLLLKDMPLKGALKDEQLSIMENGGLVINNGQLIAAGPYEDLFQQYPGINIERIDEPMVLLPGFIDCHTHICYGGTRSRDYAMRISGKSYLDIARAGGGIWDSVMKTREATDAELTASVVSRANRHLKDGVTTIEVKSGYGLDLENELKMLRAIRTAGLHTPATLIPTCLAAHMHPKDFTGSDYLHWITSELLPVVLEEQLSKRVDIFIEETAFSIPAAKPFLQRVREMGFDITVHADQFTSGSSQVAVAYKALSADHLEASTAEDIRALANSDTVAVVLPGASLGLGMHYAPARELLDAGAVLAIASDWNPGSAPMGDLLMQAAVMSAAEKLSTAEVFAGLTYRAARALGITMPDTDFQAYSCRDYRDILYYQGRMKPALVWKSGELIRTEDI